MVDDLIRQINNMDYKTYKKICFYEDKIVLGKYKLILLGKGGEGVVYGVDKYAIKFFIPNKQFSVAHKNNTREIEMSIFEKSLALLNRNVTNNFLRLFAKTKIFASTVVILDLVDGTLENWIETLHSDDEWMIMIFQVLYAVYIMQTCLKTYHNDLTIRNILFKKLNNPTVIKYKIKVGKTYSSFTFTTDIIFLIADFGCASMLEAVNKFIPKESDKYIQNTVKFAIDNNLDLKHLSILHNTLALILMKNTYKLDELIEIGKKDSSFMQYYNETKKHLKHKYNNSKNKLNYKLFRAI